MTVENQIPYQSFTANGSQTNFALSFYVEDKNHFEVKKNDQIVTINDYNYDKSSNSIVFNTPPSFGDVIEITRETTSERSTNYSTYNNSFRPEVLNKDIDRIWLKIQELGIADILLKTYADKLHLEQKKYVDQQDQIIKNIIVDLRNYVNQQDSSITNSLNNLRNYVDDHDNERNAYFEDLIYEQGISLKQLESFYEYLIQQIAAIAVEKGWDTTLVVDGWTNKTQAQLNTQNLDQTTGLVKDSAIQLSSGRTQEERNNEILSLLDFFTPQEYAEYKINPQNVDVKSAWDRAVAQADLTNKCLYAQGEFHTNQTLKLYCDADFSNAVLNSTAPETTIEIARLDYSYVDKRSIKLPKVKCKTKGSGAGWNTAGAVGVKTVNLNVCEITVPLIENFKIGLQCHATGGKGNCYTNYYLGHLNNNKINQLVSADNDGSWTNENKYFGGRYSHYSYEGTNVTGVRQIFIKAADYVPNQNIWFSPSIEGNCPEYHVENQGCWGTIYSARWEASPPKVLYSVDETITGTEFSIANQGTRNLICHGYNVDSIVFTHTGTGSAKLNRLIGSAKDIRVMSAATGGDRIKNTYSDNTGFETVFSSATANVAIAPETEYVQQRGATFIKGKRTTDPYSRIEINFTAGEIRLGTGTTDTTHTLRATATGIQTSSTIYPNTSSASLGTYSYPFKLAQLEQGIGVFGIAAPTTRPTVSGKKEPTTLAEQNVVINSLISALSQYGLIQDARTT